MLSCARQLPKVHSRRGFNAIANQRTAKWPYIDRPALGSAIRNALTNSTPAISWIVGGKGVGKSEGVYRAVDKLLKGPRDQKPLCFVFDLNEFKKSDLADGRSLAAAFVRALGSQLSQQKPPSDLFLVLSSVVNDFLDRFRNLATSRPLWAHYAKTARSPEDLWNRIVTKPEVAADVLRSMRLAPTPVEELTVYLQLLRSLKQSSSIALLHIEQLDRNVYTTPEDDSPISLLLKPDTNINVLVECNDSLKSIWNICVDDADVNVIEVADLPKEAVKAVFVPSLLSDQEHVDALYSIVGGRMALLERLVPPLAILNEEQKIEDQKQEQRYKAGKENRPSNESRELQISPLVYRREVTLCESLVNGVFKEDVDRFHQDMNMLLTRFGPLVDIRERMNETEFKVLVGESVRIIASKWDQTGCIPLPTGMSPLDIAHPVVLGLLNANILQLNWLPFSRIVAESPLKAFLLNSWYSAQLEAMSLTERARYNLISMKNRLNLEKQLEKLSH